MTERLPEESDQDPAENAPRSSLRWFPVAMAVLGLVVSAGVVLFALSDEVDAPSPEQSPGSQLPNEPVEAPTDGGIEIVDSGFTGHTEIDGDIWVTYGVVIANTSDLVAHNVRVKVSIAGFDDGNIDMSQFEGAVGTTALTPGQRHAEGGSLLLEPNERVSEALTDGKLRLDLSVDETEWWPIENRMYQFGVVTATAIKAHFPEQNENDRNRNGEDLADHITFTTSSTFESPVGVSVSGVFRDNSGAIIGGFDDRHLSEIADIDDSGDPRIGPQPTFEDDALIPPRGEDGQLGISMSDLGWNAAVEALIRKDAFPDPAVELSFSVFDQLCSETRCAWEEDD
ncbi:hypothetical protein [Stackebrandtia soli]|uniref:hypothetical protein n=1 Tax=Stackebrandtia soli TaxID=1892856 RepID=UPI0039ED3989